MSSELTSFDFVPSALLDFSSILHGAYFLTQPICFPSFWFGSRYSFVLSMWNFSVCLEFFHSLLEPNFFIFQVVFRKFEYISSRLFLRGYLVEVSLWVWATIKYDVFKFLCSSVFSLFVCVVLNLKLYLAILCINFSQDLTMKSIYGIFNVLGWHYMAANLRGRR